MTKTEMKKVFKEMMNVYKVKEGAGYEVEIESRYWIDREFDTIYCEVVFKREDEVLDDYSLEFDFNNSMGLTRNFAREVEAFFNDLKMNVTFRKIVA